MTNQLAVRIEVGFSYLKPQSRFGDTPFKFQVGCPQNGTAVLDTWYLGI